MFWTTQTTFQTLTIFLLKLLWFINKLLAKSKYIYIYMKLAIKTKYRWYLLSTPKGSKGSLKFYFSVSSLFGFRMLNWIKMHVNLLTYACGDSNYLHLVGNYILCLYGRLTNFISNSEIFFLVCFSKCAYILLSTTSMTWLFYTFIFTLWLWKLSLTWMREKIKRWFYCYCLSKTGFL